MYPELIEAYFTQMRRLYRAGYRNFFLINAPPLDKSPNAVEQGSLVSYEQELLRWNRLFAQASREFSMTFCFDCSLFHYDINTYLTYLLSPPVSARINVTITTPTFCADYSGLLDQPYYKSENCSEAVNQYFWLNIVHPTWTVMIEMARDMAAYMS